MKLSVYKWSQYYLMYSPVWRQLSKNKNIIHTQIENQNGSLSVKMNNRYQQSQQDLSERKSQYERILFQLDKKSVFNQRLSIAYDVLVFKQKQQQKKVDRKIKQNKIRQYKQVAQHWSRQKDRINRKVKDIIDKVMMGQNNQNYSINQLILQLLDSLQHDSSSTTKIQQQPIISETQQQPIISEIQQQPIISETQQQPIISETANSHQPQHVQQQQSMIQFGLKQDINININMNKSNQTSKSNKNNQTVYRINQLSKRILINQLLNLLQGQKQQTNNNSNNNSNNVNLKDSLYQITSLNLITRILTNLFTNKLNILEQQQLNDWLSAILQQTNIIYHLHCQINQFLQLIICPQEEDKFSNKITFQLIRKTVQLSQQLKVLQSSIKQLLAYINSQHHQQGIQPQLYQQLSGLIKTLSIKNNHIKNITQENKYHKNHKQQQGLQKSSQTMTAYQKQIYRLYFIKQRVNNYTKLIKGQSIDIINKQQQILHLTQKKTLSSSTHHQNNDKSTKNNKSNKSTKNINNRSREQTIQPTGVKYNLWKLTQLIYSKEQIKHYRQQQQQSSSSTIKQISFLIQNLCEQQISTTIQNICTKMGINLTNTNNINSNNNSKRSSSNNSSRLQSTYNYHEVNIQDVLYLGSITKHLLDIQQQQSLTIISNVQTKGVSFMKTLYKISQQCNRLILNYDVQQTATLRHVTVSSSCISILNNILNSFKTNGQSFFLQLRLTKVKTQQNILVYANETQFMSKLIKTLQKYLIANKQYILVSKQQLNQLKSIINHLLLKNNINQNDRNNLNQNKRNNLNQNKLLLNQQSISLLNKISTKIH